MCNKGFNNFLIDYSNPNLETDVFWPCDSLVFLSTIQTCEAYYDSIQIINQLD